MKNALIINGIALILFSIQIEITAQKANDKTGWFDKHPINISFGNASAGMPITDISVKPFYPILSLGTEFYYKQSDHSDFFQTANINYYYAKYSTSAIMFNTEVGYRYLFNFSLFVEGMLGVGYSHLFRPNAIYKLNNNGEYKQVRDYGTPTFMSDFSFSLGYNFFKKQQLPLHLYLKYGNYVDIFYAPDIPALPHNSIQIGARFFVHNKNRKNEN